MTSLSEDDVEQAAQAWFAALDYQLAYGPEISPGGENSERETYGDILLLGRLRRSIQRLNPKLTEATLEEAVHKLHRLGSPILVEANHQFHDFLVNGVSVEFSRGDGSLGYTPVRLFDFEEPSNNDWLVVNQLTIRENGHTRQPDLVVFVNGVPLAVVELKDPANEAATVWSGHRQLQTYKNEIPSLLTFNEVLVISDGLEALIGTLTASKDRFMPWRTVDGEDLAPTSRSQLEVLVCGVFEKSRFLDLVRHFVVFESDAETLSKKIAGYHQYHAVRVALQETLRATQATDTLVLEGTSWSAAQHAGKPGDRRVGVVWHTQGSGKSLTMAFYAGKVILAPEMRNPTLVILTDRNDLDDQLFSTFSRCHELLRQTPVQALDREDLRQRLHVGSGGVVFTTIQKFMPGGSGERYPEISARSNIVVIADEAHRSQYDFIDGYARHLRDALPNASFIGFTGTPVELTDKNTRAVFGDYISVYDIQQAVIDKATVPIYYESRLARLALDESERPFLDDRLEEVTENQEFEEREKLKTRWSALAALVGAEKRLDLLASDLVEHLEARLEAIKGKAMIVCMSREICVSLYNRLLEFNPQWHSDSDDKGFVKIVMTGSASDPTDWQRHIRTKARRRALANRMKDPEDELTLIIVRDMWLTGFDAPCLHTMYVDKPMQGHGLMQAIARVNRVYGNKPSGLIVDYLGLADALKQATLSYTQSGGRGETKHDKDQAIGILLREYEVCRGILHGLDWSLWLDGSPAQRLSLFPQALEHVLAQEDGKKRFIKAVRDLSKAYALAVPHEETARLRDDVAFFQKLQGMLAKGSAKEARSNEEMEFAIRQLVSRAISSDEIVDIFTAAGLDRPDISILSDEFLAEVQGLKQKNLAAELLRRLLADEISERAKTNVVQGRKFSQMLEDSIRRYQNRAITALEIIDEYIKIAKDLREAAKRGEKLGLRYDEAAFYEALELNGSAVSVLGDETLKQIACELVETVKKNVSIDWTVKESVRAKLRVIVKRILRKHGYPPDKQEDATRIVLEQAEKLSENWVTDRV